MLTLVVVLRNETEKVTQYSVFLVAEAEEDIFAIYNYVARYVSVEHADNFFSNLQNTITSLDQQPQRGHFPSELERIDVYEFREIPYKPYRVIYQIMGEDVFVHCVLHGRRELQELLQQRLLRQ